jgi:hypothetical protein
MSRVRFEPKIPVCERAKTFHALDRGATVMGRGRACAYFYIGINQRSMLAMGVKISAVIDFCDVRRPTNEYD